MLRLPLDVGGANVFRQHHKHINQKHAAEYSLTEAQVSDARNWSNLQGEALSSAVFSNVRPSSLALPLVESPLDGCTFDRVQPCNWSVAIFFSYNPRQKWFLGSGIASVGHIQQ